MSSYNATNRRDDPVNLLPVAGPTEPEQAAGEECGAVHGLGHSPFGDRHVVVGLQLAPIRWLAQDHDDAGDGAAKHGAQLRQPADAWAHFINPLEDFGVGGQEEIEEAVNKGSIKARRLKISDCISPRDVYDTYLMSRTMGSTMSMWSGRVRLRSINSFRSTSTFSSFAWMAQFFVSRRSLVLFLAKIIGG